MSGGWLEGLDELMSAAAAAEHTGQELDQVVEELALVLETALPEACTVTRAGRGAGPVRRLQVLAGKDCLLCERGVDGSWTTSIGLLHRGVVGRPRPVPAALWVRTLRQRLQDRAREQGELASRLRRFLGE